VYTISGAKRLFHAHPINPHDPIPYVQSLAPGNNDIGAVDYAAEHNLDFWINLREGIS
jgi:hypothetical protein